MKKSIYILLCSSILFFACGKKDENKTVDGMKPIYVPHNQLKVESEGVRPISEIGKIFLKGNTIYVTDIGTGVHIIDNTYPTSPTKKAFIRIASNNDVATKDFTLYADNGKNLLAINISDIHNASVQKKIEDVYKHDAMQHFPPNYEGLFECVDESKGYIVDWIQAQLNDPECIR